MLSGIATDDNGLARGAFEEVGPAGHFLGCAHTLANYETAYYDARLSDSESFEQWTEEGGRDAATRANQRWKALLADYEAPPLDAARAEALQAFVDERKNCQPDAWY